MWRTRSVRGVCTSAVLRRATPTNAPATTPYLIFDREAKQMQRTRAARRAPVDASGQRWDESQRGVPSRQTDYVREMAAESLGERLLDIKRTYPTIVELGAGAGHLRRYLDAEKTGIQKLVMCDTSVEIERRVVDEEMLPFAENSLDCIVASGSLHWTNDLPGALIQIQRALKPDGLFLGYMLGAETLFELRTSLLLAEQERHGGLSVHISPMTETRDVSALMSRAGFTMQTVDLDEITVHYPGLVELLQDLQNMGEGNAVVNRRAFLRRDTLLATAATYQGHLPATFAPIYMIGWKPAETQRKPAARGSATHSLKDVL